MEYDNRNSFVVYPNKKKAMNPKAPDYTGTYTDGNNKQWDCAVWEKVSKKDGSTFFSGTISEKKERKSGYDQHNKSKGNGYQPQDEDIDF